MKLKIFVCAFASLLFASTANSQSDQIDRTGGARPIRGQIIEESPIAVVVKLSSGNQTVSPKEIRKSILATPSNLQKQAISEFYSGNFNNCLDLLDRSEQSKDKITNTFLKTELEFCRAMAMCRESMTGGNVSLSDAGNKIYSFTKTNPNSFHFYPSSQMFAEFCVIMSGAFQDQKKKAEWLKRAKSALQPLLDKKTKDSWGEQFLEANVRMGRIALIEGQLDQALKYFAAAQDENIASKEATRIKQIARCRAWQVRGQQGNANAAKEIEKIINKESGDDKELFSNAYNALGHCYLKSGNKKSALIQFLHTQLLYTGSPDTQSEALFPSNGIMERFEASRSCWQCPKDLTWKLSEYLLRSPLSCQLNGF